MKSRIEFMKDLAKEAGKIQMQGLGKNHDVQFKGKIDIVTEVDKACEKLIVGEIKKSFPYEDVLAEEGTGERSASSTRWIIDPLDGTVNYAHNFPFFCVSIALEMEKKLVAGVIYDPVRDELFWAERGKGAYLNGEKISVSDHAPLLEALLATGFSYQVQDDKSNNNLDYFCRFIKRARAVRRPGSAAIDLAYVACGRLDGFWKSFLESWDMAAGVVIIREAGGKITSFDGGPFDLYGTEIMASNGRVHDEMVGVLK